METEVDNFPQFKDQVRMFSKETEKLYFRTKGYCRKLESRIELFDSVTRPENFGPVTLVG